jgi:glycerate kinase
MSLLKAEASFLGTGGETTHLANQNSISLTKVGLAVLVAGVVLTGVSFLVLRRRRSKPLLKQSSPDVSLPPQHTIPSSTIRILACFDSFKDSLDAGSVAGAVVGALKEVYGDKIECRSICLSDGGNGFLNALRRPLQLEMVTVRVIGALGQPLNASYGISRKAGYERMAVIEMAAASGLEQVPVELRNPLNTTTHGTGQLMLHAYKNGYTHFLVGMGGSATNDGGLGCLKALGLKVVVRKMPSTNQNKEKEENAKEKIEKENEKENEYQGESENEKDRRTETRKVEIDTEEPEIIFGRHLKYVEALEMPAEGLLPGATIEIASDVNNPFVGSHGAVAVFSAQKGATEEIQEELEAGMRHLAELYRDQLPLGIDVANMPSAGSAGGLSGGLVAAFGATIKKGIAFVGAALGLEEAIAESDLILTGEGRYDAQTEQGKTVSEVQRLAAKYGKPVVIVCGCKKDIPESATHVYDCLSMFDLKTSMTQPAKCLQELVKAKASQFPVLKDL